MTITDSNKNTVPAEGYKFNITNGQVSGISRVFGSHTQSVHLPSNATFTVAATTITETLAGTKATETIQYVQDVSDATLYHVGSDLTTITAPTTSYGNGHTLGYSFTIANGAVTAMQTTQGNASHSSTHTEQTGPTTSFALGASGGVSETIVYG